VQLELGDMVRLAAALRELAPKSSSIAEFATRVCSHLHEHLVDPDGTRQTVLVRFYGTVPYAALPPEEQDFASRTWGHPPGDALCLTLLGTVGTEPDWNDRRRSRGHRVIPLTDARQVEGLPMVAALLNQLGIDVDMLLSASAHLLHEGKVEPYGVFHVPRAKGSPAIPGQDFVTEHGVESVLGFGGALPTGEVYAVVMFTRVLVPRETAELFQNIALSTSLAALDMLATPIFPADALERVPARPLSELDRSRAREAMLTALLEVHERVAVSESDTARQALDRARHETERYSQLARTLQASLIPPELPTFKGAETAAFYRPAGDGSEVGGDFYDLFPIRDAVWGFVLGDVSGKGAGAAALTALARYTVRAAAFHAESGVDVLAALDEALHRHDADERYLTALFAEVTPLGGALQVDLTLGGHPSPLLLRADGTVEAVGEPGSVLGLLTDPSFHETRCLLRAGDALLAFTDGVTEARRGSEQYGDERLQSLLADCVGLPADAIAAGVGDAVLRFQGEHAHDDTALVVLRCT
jgi:serine phosphatase RsbU (regulator of sigma subunit)